MKLGIRTIDGTRTLDAIEGGEVVFHIGMAEDGEMPPKVLAHVLRYMAARIENSKYGFMSDGKLQAQ